MPAELLFSEGIRIDRNLRFYYAADEETGSEYGMKALLDKGLIQPEDEASFQMEEVTMAHL